MQKRGTKNGNINLCPFALDDFILGRWKKMKRIFFYQGKKISLSKMERRELESIGATREALKRYSQNDFEYYKDKNGNIYEVVNGTIQNEQTEKEFLEYFNDNEY
jgi:hypothetical protein